MFKRLAWLKAQNMNRDRKASSLRLKSFAVLALSLAATFCPNKCLAQSNLAERPKRVLLRIVNIEDLTPSDRELAEQLEIWPQLSELYDKQRILSPERKAAIRHKVMETILESCLDVASIRAEADREIVQLQVLKNYLVAKRDRNIEVNNATNFITSGTLNTVGSALGFTSKLPPFPGNFNQMMSGVVSTGMSTYALKQNSGEKIRGQDRPTLLAELFGRPTDKLTSYPESVWRFMHGNSLEQPGKTRAQLLEEGWISKHHLERHGSPHEQLKLDLVCGMAEAKKVMTIDDLTHQIHMISDIATMASQMNHHLGDLLSLVDTDLD